MNGIYLDDLHIQKPINSTLPKLGSRTFIRSIKLTARGRVHRALEYSRATNIHIFKSSIYVVLRCQLDVRVEFIDP